MTTLLAYEPELWPDLPEFLQQLDTLTAPQAAVAALQVLHRRLGASQQEEYPNLLEGQFRASDRRFPYFGRFWTWFSSLCQPWLGRDADRYTGPFTARTSNPVLIVGNRFDPAARYQGAVLLSRLLPQSRLLTLDGWGHTSAVLPSSYIAGHVNRYLLTTRVPPPGTVCPPDLVPFAQPATSPRTDFRTASRLPRQCSAGPPTADRPEPHGRHAGVGGVLRSLPHEATGLIGGTMVAAET